MNDPLRYLLSLEQFGIKFGLDNIQAIADRLDRPERAFSTVHVAGTNGKGSVVAMLDAALRSAGYRVGRYTSPHLRDLTERFVVDGQAVTTDALASAVGEVRDAIEGLRAEGILTVQPTFFEVTTAAAFELFRRARIDIGVVEVGLGGRLDATNIVSPLTTAITSIGFDHEQYLGNSLHDIAVEKAGIIKPDVPVVVGEMPPEADLAIEQIAARQRAPVIHALHGVLVESMSGGDRSTSAGQRILLRTPAHDYGELTLGLLGDHQVGNALVAVRTLETLQSWRHGVPADAIADGLASVSWPGRLDVRRLADGREVVLDAAHNPAGAHALAAYLERLPGPRIPMVIAIMRDKDKESMIRTFAPVVSAFVLTRASNPRSTDPVVLAELVRRITPDTPAVVEPQVVSALAAAWRLSARITIAGSVFLLGDALPLL